MTSMFQEREGELVMLEGLRLSWALYSLGCLRGALAPLYKIFPLPLQGKGVRSKTLRGDGVNAAEKRNMIICVTNLSELAQALPLQLGSVMLD